MSPSTPPHRDVTAADVAAAKVEEARAQADLRSSAAGRRTLPLLDQLRIASPCNAPWEKMTGTDRARYCGLCEKTVYNVSAMSREEAEQFLSSVETACVRFYQRTDGTILTADCPVGISRKRRRTFAWSLVATAVASIAGALGFHFRRGAIPEPAQGKMEASDFPAPMGVVAVPDDTVRMPMGVMVPIPKPSVTGAVPKPNTPKRHP
jgi:hypothetical protein